MFQKNNAAREIFYIFLWLMGIIIFYALVHTFLLEPCTCQAERIKSTSIQDVGTAGWKKTKTEHTKTVTHAVKTETKHLSKPVKPNSIKASSVIKTVDIPVHIETTEPTLIKASVKHVDIEKIPKIEIPITPVLKVPTVPTTPKLPTVSTPVTVVKPPQLKQAIATNNQTVMIEEKRETQKVKPTYDRNESMRLLETVRQETLKKAEIAREAAMKDINAL